MKEATKISPKTPDDLIGLVLNENQIEKNQIPLEELFYLKFTGEVIGPVWIQNLKEYLKFHNNQIEATVQIRTFSGSQWINLFEHPLFTRRKPQVLADKNLSGNEQFHVLEHGMLMGPYHLDTIKNKIQQNELVLNDMLSTDNGKTWQKIYKFDIFDRRNQNHSAPPTSPENINEIASNTQTSELSNFSEIADLYNIRPLANKKVFSKNVLTSSKKILHNRPFAILVILLIGLISLIVLTDMLTSTSIVEEDTSALKQEQAPVSSKEVRSLKTKSNFESKKKKIDSTSNNVEEQSPSRTGAYTRSKNVFRRERGNTWVKEVSNPENEPSRDVNANVNEDQNDYGEMDSEDAVHNSREGFLEKLDQASSDAEQTVETSD